MGGKEFHTDKLCSLFSSPILVEEGRDSHALATDDLPASAA